VTGMDNVAPFQFRRTHHCRPLLDRALCAATNCPYNDPDGSCARAGRTQILTDLQQPYEPNDCNCRKCWGRGRPFTDTEVAGVLDHVSDRIATLYALGKVDLGSFLGCEDCGGWVPSFTDSPSSTPGTLENATCPYHPEGMEHS
jgi:hypothetical protein